MPNFKIHQEGDFNYVTKDTEEPVEDYTELLNNLLKEKKIQEFKPDGSDEYGNNLFQIKVRGISHTKLSHKETRELLEKISKEVKK